MEDKKKLIFITNPGLVDAPMLGGVQVCTREFIEAFKAAGFDVHIFPIHLSRSFSTRIKIKLGIEIYSKYDAAAHERDMVKLIQETGARIIAINMSDAVAMAKPIRKHFGDTVKVILLSHGNESGDFLPEIVRHPNENRWLRRFRDAYRLGGQLIYESQIRKYIDHVFCISETEIGIEHWLGAQRVTFIPRVIRPHYLPWQPVPGRIGYVGTMSHLPNVGGLDLLLQALRRQQAKGLEIRVVGGPKGDGERFCSRDPLLNYLGPLDDQSLSQEATTWSMFVHPIFWYSRGASTKLALAISWGIPVITTLAGKRGYEFRKGGILLADNPDHMASLIIKSLPDKTQLESLTAEVKKAAESGPTLEDVAKRLYAAITQEMTD